MGWRCWRKDDKVAAVERSIVDALREKSEELKRARLKAGEKGEPPRPSFEAVIVKLMVIKTLLTVIKNVFRDLDLDCSGQLDREEILVAFQRLKVDISEDTLSILFHMSDFDGQSQLTYQQFFVLCTVGHLLRVTPSFEALRADAAPCVHDFAAASPEKKEAKIQSGDNNTNTVAHILDILISAYLVFDPLCRGFIRRADVAPKTAKQNSVRGLMPSERWQEMDWDSNGTVDFTEFVFAVTRWVDPEDGELSEDEEGSFGGRANHSDRAHGG